MKVTLDDLIAHGAEAGCAGLAAFREQYPAGVAEAEWTLDAQLALLRTPLRRWFGWSVAVGIVPMWSMRGAYLYGAHLRGANLRGAIGLPSEVVNG